PDSPHTVRAWPSALSRRVNASGSVAALNTRNPTFASSVGGPKEQPHPAISPVEMTVVAGVVDVDAGAELVPAEAKSEVLPRHVEHGGVVVLQVAVVRLELQREELKHRIEAPVRIELPDVVQPDH